MTKKKPFAPSCEKNQDPILQVLLRHLGDVSTLLEIGSGTGQHAVHMASHFPDLQWQTSELADKHDGLNLWLDEAHAPNILRPVVLDVTNNQWPNTTTEAIYTANTAHIMSWTAVQSMFAGVGRLLNVGGLFCIYGPFNYNGEFTSAGNAKFDETLRSRDPASGIRDFEALERLALSDGMRLKEDAEMPANNRFLIWQKT